MRSIFILSSLAALFGMLGALLLALPSYPGWGFGAFLVSNIAWLTVSADSNIIFDTPVEQRYDRALSLLGLQSWMLTHQAGHA